MESRIATLLGDSSSLDRAGLDPLQLLPPPSLAPRTRPPHPLEPNAVNVNDEDRNTRTATTKTTGNLSNDTRPHLLTANQRKRQKPCVPIAGVLNHETIPTLNIAHHAPSTSPSSLPPFSGRLSDLLLDPSQQHVNKRRRLDEHQHATTCPAVLAGGGSGNKLKLPEPTQQPSKKTPKRPRIPPLLQGLHHPPPLPEKAFPPITGEGSGFGREIAERSKVRSPPARPLGRIQEREQRDDTIRDNQPPTRAEKTSKDSTTGKPTIPTSSTSDKENQDRCLQKDAFVESGAKPSTQTKGTRKRNKWSDEETKDLLLGVSRFGIGNWKKILQCPDFTFHQRTAVDLKDRFRVCCPGDGLKLRKSRRKDNVEEGSSSLQANPLLPPPASLASPLVTQDLAVTRDRGRQNQDLTAPPSTETAINKSRRPRPETDRKGPAELAEMGIHTPFTKHKRRMRREFTKEDDANLLIGFEKYNTSWHLMRDDKTLGFDGRHATDLRDRFRIRYPEKFAKAGCKPKAKDETMLKEKEEKRKHEEQGRSKDDGEAEEENSTAGRVTASRPQQTEAALLNPTSSRSSSSQVVSTALPPSLTSVSGPTTTSIATYRPHALHKPLHCSFPSLIPDFPDLASDADADGMSSPIVLSRNILEWVEANPSSQAQISMSNLVASSSFPTDASSSSSLGVPLFNGSDVMHMDPNVMYNGTSMSLLTSTVLSTISPSTQQKQQRSAGPHTSNSHPTSTPANNTKSISTLLTTTTSKSSSIPIISSSSSTTNHLLRTPNLPTMIYPPVPVSSARSAVHNLPPPADLLSGLGLDHEVLRTDATAAPANSSIGTASTNQTGNFILDDVGSGSFVFAALPPSALGVGAGFDSSATLAPMVVRGSTAVAAMGGRGTGVGGVGAGHGGGAGVFHLDRELFG